MKQDQANAHEGYMPLGAFAAQCDACSTHNAFDRLGKITAPALLTVGDADIFTPLRLTAEMHEQDAPCGAARFRRAGTHPPLGRSQPVQ